MQNAGSDGHTVSVLVRQQSHPLDARRLESLILRMLGTLHARPYEQWADFIDPQYVDQSHMIRDFQYFLGMSPSRYFAQDRPILKAATKGRAALMGQPLQGLHAAPKR